MNNNLGIIGLIMLAFMMLVVVGLFSNKIESTTPIDKPHNPPAKEDICWWVEEESCEQGK